MSLCPLSPLAAVCAIRISSPVISEARVGRRGRCFWRRCLLNRRTRRGWRFIVSGRGPARLTLVRGGLTLVLPILPSPWDSSVFCFWIYAYPAFLIYAAHSSGDWTSPKAGVILPARLVERASTSRLPRCSLAEIADVSRRRSLIASSAGCFSARISVSSPLLAATMTQISFLPENPAVSQRR